jgi:hypothetical protein
MRARVVSKARALPAASSRALGFIVDPLAVERPADRLLSRRVPRHGPPSPTVAATSGRARSQDARPADGTPRPGESYSDVILPLAEP